MDGNFYLYLYLGQKLKKIEFRSENTYKFFNYESPGYDDCGDRADEQQIFCVNQKCTQHYVRCPSGRCIPGIKLDRKCQNINICNKRYKAYNFLIF